MQAWQIQSNLQLIKRKAGIQLSMESKNGFKRSLGGKNYNVAVVTWSLL